MKKILLIEDDSFLTDIYLTKLKGEGYQVDVARDGESGLEKVKKLKPDLLILDIILPKFNGWEVLGQIRKDPKFEKLKVIIISNLGDEKDIERGFDLGAIKYFVKTEQTPTEVVEKIKEILK